MIPLHTMAQSSTLLRITNTTLDAWSLTLSRQYYPYLEACTDSQNLSVTLREAKVEFGEHVASKLKLSKDGTKVLWPQPTDDPEDPQNVRLPNL